MHRTVAFVTALLLALPLLVITGPGASASSHLDYRLTWLSAFDSDTGHPSYASGSSAGSGGLLRSLVTDGTSLTDVEEEFTVDGDVVDIDDCEAPTFESDVTDDTAIDCDVDFDLSEGDGLTTTIESTITAEHDGDPVVLTATATIVRVDLEVEFEHEGNSLQHVEVQVGDSIEFEVEVDNRGAIALEHRWVELGDGPLAPPLHDCTGLPTVIEPGESTTTTCTIEDIDQYTPPRCVPT